MAQLDGVQEGVVKGEEEGNLQDHRQAAAHRVDLLVAVELHHGAVEALLVVLVQRLQLLHFRLQLLHGLHGLVALVGQRPEDDLDEDGDQDDGHAVVVDPAVDQAQELQHGPGHGGEEAQIDDLGERRLDRVQQGFFLGPDVYLHGLLRSVGKQRRADGNTQRAIVAVMNNDGVGLRLAGNQGGGKIGVAKGGPRYRPLLNDGSAGLVRHGVNDFAVHVTAGQDGGLTAAYVVLAGLKEAGPPLRMQGIVGTRRQALHRGADLKVVPALGKTIDTVHDDAVIQGAAEGDFGVRADIGQHHVLAVGREELAAQRNRQGTVRHDVANQRHRRRAAHRTDLDGRRVVVKARAVIVELNHLHPGAAARQGNQGHPGIHLDEPLLDFGSCQLDGFAWSGCGRGCLFGNTRRFQRQLRIGGERAGRGGIVKFGRGWRRRSKHNRPHDDHDQGQDDGQDGSFFHASVLWHDQGREDQRRRATGAGSAVCAKHPSTGRATAHTRATPGRRIQNNWDKSGKTGERGVTGPSGTAG